jgi:ankyrin repeat protein
VARLLIDTGADVSAAKSNGSTPLRLTAENGYEAVVRLFCDRGATGNRLTAALAPTSSL